MLDESKTSRESEVPHAFCLCQVMGKESEEQQGFQG